MIVLYTDLYNRRYSTFLKKRMNSTYWNYKLY